MVIHRPHSPIRSYDRCEGPRGGGGREHMPWGSHTPVLGGSTRCQPSPGGLAVHRCSRLGTHASELEVGAESGPDFRRFGSEVYQAERSQGSVRILDVHPRGLGRALRVPGRTAAAPLHIEAARSPPCPSEGCHPGLSHSDHPAGPVTRPVTGSRSRSGRPAGRRLPAAPRPACTRLARCQLNPRARRAGQWAAALVSPPCCGPIATRAGREAGRRPPSSGACAVAADGWLVRG